MRYFRPKSLTWWVSVAAIGLGVTSMICTQCDLGEINNIIAAFNGSVDASPSGLVLGGLAAIGIGDKIDRMRMEYEA